MKNTKRNNSQVGRKLMAMALIGATVVTFSGCSKVGDSETKKQLAILQSELDTAKNDLTAAQMQANDYKSQYDNLVGIAAMYPEIADLTDFGSNVTLKDGSTARLKLKGKVNLGKWYQTQSNKVIDTRTLTLVDGLTMQLGTNWTVAFGENEVKLSHTDGIYADLKYGETMQLEDYSVRRENEIKPYLDSIQAKVMEEKDIVCDGTPCGTMAICKIKVIDSKVIKDWDALLDRDKLATEAEDKATKLEKQADKLEKQVKEMKAANEAYNSLSKKEKKKQKDTAVTYTKEEISKVTNDAKDAKAQAEEQRKTATELREDAPTPDLAKDYQLVFVEAVWGGSQIYGYVVYKDTDYESVWESVETMLGSITMGVSSLSFK